MKLKLVKAEDIKPGDYICLATNDGVMMARKVIRFDSKQPWGKVYDYLFELERYGGHIRLSETEMYLVGYDVENEGD